MRDLYKLFSYLRPYWLFAVLAPLLMVTEVSLDLLQPRFVQHIIDEGVAKSDIHVVLHTGLLMVGTFLVAMLAGAGCTFFAVRAGHRMGGDVRGAVFRKIQSFSFANLDRLETGSLITRLTSDVNQVQEMVSMMLRGMVRMPLLLIGSVAMAVLINVRLGVILFVILPILITALVLIIRSTFPLYRLVQERLDGVNTVLQENLAGVRVVKAFARAPHETARFGVANDALVAGMTAAIRMSARTTPIMMLTLNTGIVAALWLGGRQVYVGDMKVGQVVAFINYLTQALNALMLFSNLIIQISRAQASARRVSELLRTEPDVAHVLSSGTQAAAPGGKRIEFEHVTFGYRGPGHEPQLKNVSFHVEAGETIAIVGATGAGKSSLVQLVPRFYDVDAGRITIDGVDVRDLPQLELRRWVSIALQESILFSASIRENLAFGKSGAEESEVVHAARLAQAEEFILRRPEGYDTLIGQRGVNLSGGQKQRLAIARALLPEAPILILDDSTSAVDVMTEARIRNGLNESKSGQTRLIVAQRISSVLDADRVLVLDDGHLVGQGKHLDLLASCAIYREIYDSQTKRGAIAHGSA